MDSDMAAIPAVTVAKIQAGARRANDQAGHQRGKPEQGETGLKSQTFHLASLWGHHDMAQQPAGLGNGLRSRHANNNCSAGKVGMIIKKYCK
jgi:hypothetical protein